MIFDHFVSQDITIIALAQPELWILLFDVNLREREIRGIILLSRSGVDVE